MQQPPEFFTDLHKAKEFIASTSFKKFTIASYRVDYDGTMYYNSRKTGRIALLDDFDFYVSIDDTLMCDSALMVISISNGRVICVCDMKNTAAGGYPFPQSNATRKENGTV